MCVALNAHVRKTLVALVFFTSLLPFAAFAQSGMWGSRGVSRQFLLRGTRLYDVDGRGVAVYDVGDPAHIRRISFVQRDSESLSGAFLGTSELDVLTRTGIDRYTIQSDGSLFRTEEVELTGYSSLTGNGSILATVSPTGDSVTLWRMADEGLERFAEIAAGGHVNAIAFHNGAMYVAVEGVAVLVFPTNGGTHSIGLLSMNAKGLAIVGDTLYAAAGSSGIITADIRDDAAPAIIDRFGGGEINLQSIAASGTRVYATQAGNFIRIYDVSSGTPREISTMSEPASVIAASGTNLFVSGSLVDRNNLTNETGTPVRIFDMTTLTAPKLAGEYRDYAGPVSGVATNGSLAYVVDPPYLRVIDISQTAAPREIASLQIPNIQDHIRVFGNLALIYGRGDVDVVDILDPYAPRYIARYESLGAAPSSASMLGNELIEGNPTTGFHIVDFRDYSPPAQIGGVKWHYFEILSRGDAVYLFEDSGVRVLDATDRGNVVITSYADVVGRTGDIVDATANHPELLVAGSVSGMHLFTLADRFVPMPAGTLRVPFGGTYASTGDTVWYAYPGFLQKIDVTNPMQPSAETTSMAVTSPMQIAAAGDKIVVADRYSLRVFGPDTAPPPPQQLLRRRRSSHR
jgi:hypothetical protein